MKLNVKKLSDNAKVPYRAYEHDAGLDLFSLNSFKLAPGETFPVATGIAVEIPVGFVGLCRDRSSMGRKGISVLAGVIDSGYRGEILVVLHNLTQEHFEFEAGSKIAQMLLLPVSTMPTFEVEELGTSERGEKGFGSSGS
jgi:dUTP pyrophosphatase